MCLTLVDVLMDQRDNKVDGSVYKAVQCDFAYNSNKIEGSKLTHEQTVMLWDMDLIDGLAYRDDVVVVGNHFAAFDYTLDHCHEPITPELVKRLQEMVLAGTKASHDPRYNVGDYKQHENVVIADGQACEFAKPSEVSALMDALLADWEGCNQHRLEDVIEFHVRFESIHPFSDGNGRVGRLLMFKELMRNEITPFIVSHDLGSFYLRGLRMWGQERSILLNTCLTAQRRFEDYYIPMARSYANAING